jgi:transcription elongation factor Elf1
MASDIEILGQENNTFECPSCGNNAYHLKGVYVNEEFKYTNIMTVLECESCISNFGTINSFGKGTDFIDFVVVKSISNDWKKVL